MSLLYFLYSIFYILLFSLKMKEKIIHSHKIIFSSKAKISQKKKKYNQESKEKKINRIPQRLEPLIETLC